MIKFKNHGHKSGHKSFSVIQSAGIKNWFLQLINRLQRLSLLFLSVTCFTDFSDKIYMIRIKTHKKVLQNLGNIFKMNTSLTVSPRAVFNVQSKVCGGAFLQN